MPPGESDMLESARGLMSARPSGVLEMCRWEPGVPYLSISEGEPYCEVEPPGVVGEYAL